MGLRINTNISGIRALRNLHVNDRNQQHSLERLSTGLRINRASDDPSGLVISERLRAQIGSQRQAIENAQNDVNMVTVADDALGQISNLLTDIKTSVVFTQNSGGNSPDQVAAEQDAVDQAIAGIDRIAATTRYGSRGLLDGSSAYTTGTVNGNGVVVPDEINDLHIRSVVFTSGQTLRNLTYTAGTDPERGTVAVGGAAGVSGVVRITGSRGSKDLVVGATSTIDELANSVSDVTGVYADGAGNLVTEDFGSAEVVTFSVMSSEDGTAVFGINPGDSQSGRGVDGSIIFAGQQVSGTGLHFKLDNGSINLDFTLDDLEDFGSNTYTITGGTFSVHNTGLVFQLGEKAQSSDQQPIGIDGASSGQLGIQDRYNIIADALQNAAAGPAGTVSNALRQGGHLTDLRSGGLYDLRTDPNNASFIVDNAIAQISNERAFLGAVAADSLQPSIDSTEVSVENLSASLSSIRDLDFAEETTQFTKTQILFQAGTAVLASANLIPQTVLTLLR